MNLINNGIHVYADVGDAVRGFQQLGQQQMRLIQDSRRFAQEVPRNWDSALAAPFNRFNNILSNTTGRVNQNMEQMRGNMQRFQYQVRNLQNELNSVVMAGVATSMTGVGFMNAGRAITGFFTEAISMASKFEKTMKEVKFLGQLDNSQLAEATRQVQELGMAMPTTNQKVAEGLVEIQRAGYDYNKAMKMLKPVTEMAFLSGGKMDEAESVKFLNGYLKTTGKDVDYAKTALDKVAKTADLFTTDIDGINRAFQSTRAAYDNMGLRRSETGEDSFLTLMGMMSTQFQPRASGMMMNSMSRGMLQAMGSSPESKRGGLWAALGIDLEKEDDILKVFDKINTKSKELWGNTKAREEKLIDLFGVEGLPVIQMMDKYKESGIDPFNLRDQLGKGSKGYSDKYMEEMMNTTYGTQKILEGAKETLMTIMGLSVLGPVNKVLKGVADGLAAIGKFAQQHPQLTKFVAMTGLVAGALTMVVGGILIFVGALMSMYGSIASAAVTLGALGNSAEVAGRGFSTMGQIFRSQTMGPLLMMGKKLLWLSALSGFAYIAWTHDFLGMKTAVTGWVNEVDRGMKRAKKTMGLLGNNDFLFKEQFRQNDALGGIEGKLSNAIVKAQILKKSLKDYYSTDKGDNKNVVNMQQMQMVGVDQSFISIVHAIENVKQFWDGFIGGLKDGFEMLKVFVSPLVEILGWVKEKLLELSKALGFFDGIDDNATGFKAMGQNLGVALGLALAIRGAIFLWSKAIRTALAPLKLMGKLMGGVGKMGRGMRDSYRQGGMMGMVGRGARATGRGAARLLVPEADRRRAAGGYNRAMDVNDRARRRRNEGLHTRLNTRVERDENGNRRIVYGQGGTLARQGRNGESSRRVRNQGFKGFMQRLWRGDQYLPDRQITRNGNMQNRIRTRRGHNTLSDANGRVRGQNRYTGGLRDFLFSPIRTMREKMGGARQAVTRSIPPSVRSGPSNAWNKVKGFGASIMGIPGRIGNATRGARQTMAQRRRYMNARNFVDAGMNYTDSRQRKGHWARSIKAAVVGSKNRSQRMGVAGNTSMMMPFSSFQRQEAARAGTRVAAGGAVRGGAGAATRAGAGGAVRAGGAAAGLTRAASRGGATTARAGGGIVSKMFSGVGKMFGAGGKVGGSLLKGFALLGPKAGGMLGKGLMMGLSLVGKGLMRAIPIVGWALLAWDAISMIFSNWDSIKAGAATAWEWIKTTASNAWTWISTEGVALLGQFWNNLPIWAGQAWEWVKSVASAAWNWICTDGVALLGQFWNNLPIWAAAAWEWVKTAASNAWNWICTDGMTILGNLWNWITGTAMPWVWETAKTLAADAWNWICTDGMTLLGNLWNWITGTALPWVWETAKTMATDAWNYMVTSGQELLQAIWDWIVQKAQEAWENTKQWAVDAFNSMVSDAQAYLADLFAPIKSAWDDAKSYVMNNPIVQTVTKVVKTVGDGIGAAGDFIGGLMGHRTGLYKVPKDDYVARLHGGEMVLTKSEAQFARSIMGSSDNFITAMKKRMSEGDSSVESALSAGSSSPRKVAIPMPVPTPVSEAPQGSGQGGGATTITFAQGAVQIHVDNLSDPAETDKGARQLFEKFKKMMEIENIRNYGNRQGN